MNSLQDFHRRVMTAHCTFAAACIEGAETDPASRIRDSRPFLSCDKRLAAIGITKPGTLHWNTGRAALVESAVRAGEGTLAAGGALVCRTGKFTGRSPDDKFFVRDAATKEGIEWGKVNRPMEPGKFEALRSRIVAHLQGRELYVQDCDAGADPAHRLAVRRGDGAGLAQPLRPQHLPAAGPSGRRQSGMDDPPRARAARPIPKPMAAGARQSSRSAFPRSSS